MIFSAVFTVNKAGNAGVNDARYQQEHEVHEDVCCLASSPPRALIRTERAPLFNLIDLVNRLQTGHRDGRAGSPIIRLDFVVLDELGFCPLRKAQSNYAST